jgi:hypothetical protein
MKYFTMNELTASATAKRKGIVNIPGKFEAANLIELVEKILDPLREAWGAPIIVTSGYRCRNLNTVVGGAKSSQHCLGQAADIRTVSDRREDNRKLRDLIVSLNLPFDQLIDEYQCDWIHVSYRPNFRKQILSAVRSGGKTIYKQGFL